MQTMQESYTLDIAESDTAIFIHLDKGLLQNNDIKQAVTILRTSKNKRTTGLPLIDDSHIPEMSDDEQTEIETILDAMTDENREIAFSEIVEIEL